MAIDLQTPPPALTPSCLTGNLGWMLDQVNHALGCEVASALSPLGLGQRGFCVLQTAVDAELSQTQIAAAIGVDKTTMVVTVDELERQGLAERVPSPTDRRARVIRVTEAGRAKVEEGLRIVETVQADVLSALPAGEREAFVDGLVTLVTGRLSNVPQCHPPLRRREPRG
jgi:MarR family transcriptional regulator for hemolysin